MPQFITPGQAAQLVKDGAMIALGGFGSHNGPDALLQALADRYRESAHPAKLTVVTGVSTGDNSQDDIGMNRIAIEGLIDTIIAAHLANPPKISAMAAANQIAAYTLPLGVMELRPNCVINLGIGIPSGVGSVANEEGINDRAILSLESGPLGGVPLEGVGFASSMNPETINSICDTFDFYDGGFLDMTFLGAAEVDQQGNVNVSKFGPRCPGPGGFINISQNTPAVYFMSGFTAGKSQIEVADGKLNIRQDGPGVKFIRKVQQITFSAENALRNGQRVHYITERAVFRLTPDGIELIEIAPGVDLERDILGRMEFRPLIAEDLKVMDPRIFRDELMGLKD